MNVVFVLSIFSHYQVSLSDCIYYQNNGNFVFVETMPIPESRLNDGFPLLERPYLIRAWVNESQYNEAMRMATDADVLVCSTELSALPFKRNRLKEGKLTFEYSERPLKKGFLNAFSKTNIINQLFYHFSFYKKPLYKLCAGAYVANDQYLMRSFKGKCYKFGYFPKVEPLDISEIINKKSEPVKILWCARFLKWKHPEMMIELAKMLKAHGIGAEIDMVGTGSLFEGISSSVSDNGLTDIVHLLGGLPNEQVLEMMQSHHVFILSSDKREGWGAVVNEAMANGCCVVVSDAVGCVPYLIKDGVNGMTFKSGSIESLFEKVQNLIDCPDMMTKMISQAYKTISEDWSPEKAANHLLILSECLLKGKECSIEAGPCCKALPVSIR